MRAVNSFIENSFLGNSWLSVVRKHGLLISAKSEVLTTTIIKIEGVGNLLENIRTKEVEYQLSSAKHVLPIDIGKPTKSQ